MRRDRDSYEEQQSYNNVVAILIRLGWPTLVLAAARARLLSALAVQSSKAMPKGFF